MAPAKVIAWPDPPPSPTRSERVFAALDRLACDPEVTTELVGLAAGIGSRRVKAILAEVDTTFTAELLVRRMARARGLLTETSFAVRNVARLCGYRDSSTFAKRFAALHGGVKPRDYRVARGGTPRVGGTTGAFHKPAQRARAKEVGAPEPGMRRGRMLAGTTQVLLAEIENRTRRAALRGEPAPRRSWPAVEDRYDPYWEAHIDDYLESYREEWSADDADPDQ